MAEDDLRVHRASEVHKRRVRRKVRPEAKSVEKPTGEPKSTAKQKSASRPRTRFVSSVDDHEAALTQALGPSPAPGARAEDAGNRDSAAISQSAAQPVSRASVRHGASSSGRVKKSFNDAKSEKNAGSASAPSRGRSIEVGGATSAQEEKPRKKPRRKMWIAIGIVAFVVVALAATAAALAWNRWARYDDSADIQGIWYAYGTKVAVTFTQDSIVFDEDTAYSYEIDPEAKTIRYSIGDMEGQGRYWFDDDRSVLVVTDGADFTKWGTALDDASLWVHDLLNGASLPLTEDSIAFSRTAMSDGLAASASEEGAGEAQVVESVGEGGSAKEQPAETSDDKPNGDSGDESIEGSSGKDSMKELPISDIIEEDDTPVWSKKADE